LEKTLEIKRKAQRFVQNGDLDRAVEEYQKLLAADDTDPYTHVTLGDLYFKKGVLDEAGRRYQEAAEAYRKAGLVKNAIAVCKKMLRLNLRNIDTLRSLGELHHRRADQSPPADARSCGPRAAPPRDARRAPRAPADES